jgi:hypothetical protein
MSSKRKQSTVVHTLGSKVEAGVRLCGTVTAVFAGGGAVEAAYKKKTIE